MEPEVVDMKLISKKDVLVQEFEQVHRGLEDWLADILYVRRFYQSPASLFLE